MPSGWEDMMKRLSCITLGFFLLLTFVVGIRGQEQLPRVIPTMSRETHGKLFDILFPLDVLHSPDNEFVWYKGNEIFEQTKRDDPVEIARLIGVTKREFDVPFPKARRWRKGLLNGVALALAPKNLETPIPPKSESIILDGTIYEMWDISKSGELHYSAYWGEVNNRIYPDDPTFIRWMKVVRRESSKRQ
jgi:hypothetical protein